VADEQRGGDVAERPTERVAVDLPPGVDQRERAVPKLGADVVDALDEAIEVERRRAVGIGRQRPTPLLGPGVVVHLADVRVGLEVEPPDPLLAVDVVAGREDVLDALLEVRALVVGPGVCDAVDVDIGSSNVDRPPGNPVDRPRRVERALGERAPGRLPGEVGVVGRVGLGDRLELVEGLRGLQAPEALRVTLGQDIGGGATSRDHHRR